MLKPLLLALGLFVIAPALAQTAPPVPASYTLKAPADFAQYSSQVVETVGWLEKSKLSSNDAQRRQANTFLMEWMTGSPTVSIQVSGE